jgi:hypothetical protein
MHKNGLKLLVWYPKLVCQHFHAQNLDNATVEIFGVVFFRNVKIWPKFEEFFVVFLFARIQPRNFITVIVPINLNKQKIRKVCNFLSLGDPLLHQ